MKVPARFYASEKMLDQLFKDRSLEQLVNVATLPGVEKYALAMPDIHEGYGFPIGGVAGIDAETGVISPGGVGYDINCGVRLLRSEKSFDEIKHKLVDLVNQIQRDVPSGVGRGGRIKLEKESMDKILTLGARRAVELGYAKEEDLENCEERGSMPGADASAVSDRAKRRGYDQCGTLGSGNHFLEIQRVEQIFNQEAAKVFGLFKDQVTIMIHSGSRGLGHQVCTDYVRLMQSAMAKYNIRLPDQELACAPFSSPEGQQYFKAMAASANFAWANRLMMAYLIRQAWKQVIGQGELESVYDVAHNIAKIERHDMNRRISTNLYTNRTNHESDVNIKVKELIVHRKGATRAFGPGSKEVPEKYREVGQPVLIPGSMGTASYVLAGSGKAMQETFGSVCHGAGRRMSRAAAKKQIDAGKLKKDLEAKGIIIRCGSARGLAEEAPLAYKDIDNVVQVVAEAGLAQKVARLKPVGVVKGG
ncbi:RtcB family protein [Candidatus Parcubacteria bacterium]|nr:RtcB family protein [Candidatus Parcubacteria bacterium]